uniref:Uncharacterized protein n=1 Tax=Periophthalmus magnuspinnatus TaxID=409849 RepID=A0A3B3ZPH1_9GOBI
MGSSSDSNYRSRRDDHDFHGKPPPLHWKDSRGRGRPPMVKRVPSVGEPRESRFNNWRPSNEDSYHSYPSKTEPHHQRRPSPSRPNRSPHGQHHPRSPAHRGPPFHSHPPPGHRSQSPRHFHSHPEDRRPGPPPPFRGSFRGKRYPGFSHPEQRSRDPPVNYSPRDRPYEPSHMRRWNGAGAFSHNDKSPREFHGRGLERYTNHAMGHDDVKHPRRERPQLMNMPRPVAPRPFGPRPFGPRPFGTRPFAPRPFGARPFGRPLSLRDRSFLIKSRQMRAESLMKLRLPPSFKARASFSSVLALRKKRFESGAAPLRKLEPRETRPKQSPTKAEGNASQSSSDSKEQVESRRSVNSHRYSISLFALSAGKTWPTYGMFHCFNDAIILLFRVNTFVRIQPCVLFFKDRFQRPAFRKSLSIVSKYRNMRVMRQRGSYSRGPDQRW